MFRSFRPLGIFWAAVLAVLLAGGAVLQWLGPVREAGSASHAPPSPTNASAPPASPEKQAASSPEPPAVKPPPAKTAPLSVPPGPVGLGPAPLPAATGPRIPEPLAALLEPATELPGRMLARISADGRRPDQVYAGAFPATERHPRVALVLDGVGLNKGLSETVLRSLPAAVDIAMSAYAPPDLAEQLAAAARDHGRECLVSLPMEPAGYPLAEEGDQALLTGADPQQNRKRMQAALSHVQGCVGVTGASDGMAGERFSAMHAAFGDVLLEFSSRGLLYLDARPGAPQPDGLPAGARPPLVADVVVDRTTDAALPAAAETIDARLAALETLAAEHGSAIGVAGPPRPVLLERLAVWANGLAARGLVLAPLSAVRPRESGK